MCISIYKSWNAWWVLSEGGHVSGLDPTSKVFAESAQQKLVDVEQSGTDLGATLHCVVWQLLWVTRREALLDWKWHGVCGVRASGHGGIPCKRDVVDSTHSVSMKELLKVGEDFLACP